MGGPHRSPGSAILRRSQRGRERERKKCGKLPVFPGEVAAPDRGTEMPEVKIGRQRSDRTMMDLIEMKPPGRHSRMKQQQ